MWIWVRGLCSQGSSMNYYSTTIVLRLTIVSPVAQKKWITVNEISGCSMKVVVGSSGLVCVLIKTQEVFKKPAVWWIWICSVLGNVEGHIDRPDRLYAAGHYWWSKVQTQWSQWAKNTMSSPGGHQGEEPAQQFLCGQADNLCLISQIWWFIKLGFQRVFLFLFFFREHI